MKILELYQDYHIPHFTEGHKHCRPGWVNVECPFCTGAHSGYHLGYNLAYDYFHCWRCGGKFPDQALVKILHLNHNQIDSVIKEYGGISKKPKTDKEETVALKPFKYPSGELELKPAHIKYLERRHFDPDYLEHVWGLTGTGPVAYLDGIKYDRRILAPIEWEGRIVSFQTRNLKDGDDNPYKYLACPQAREQIEHQTILYGHPLKWKRRGIGVEGITDVWRFGEQSFGVFGTSVKNEQIRWMSKLFEEIILVFDPEPAAQDTAKQIVSELKFRGVKAWIENIETDPGEMSQDDADHLVKQIMK